MDVRTGARIGGVFGDWLTIELGVRRTDQQILEAGFELLPLPGLGIFGGWRRQEFHEDRSGSDLDFEFHGPVPGLRLVF